MPLDSWTETAEPLVTMAGREKESVSRSVPPRRTDNAKLKKESAAFFPFFNGKGGKGALRVCVCACSCKVSKEKNEQVTCASSHLQRICCIYDLNVRAFFQENTKIS